VANALGLIQPEVYTNVVKDQILDPITAEESFKMNETESKSILGSLGNWYAINVSSISPAESPNYELQKEALRQTLLTEKAQEEIYDITGTIEDLMTDGLTLEEISDSINWPLSYYNYIDRSGSDQTGIKMNGLEAIPGIASDESILEETFIADLGFETDLFETRNGGYASVRVDEIIDSQRMPYEEVKYPATQAWKQSQKNSLLNSLATEIVKDINEGLTLKEVVLNLKNKSITEQIIIRGQPPRNLGNSIVIDIFDSNKGAVVQGDAPTKNTKQIAILEEVLSSEEFPTGEILKIIQDRSSQEISNDVQNAYQQAILKDKTLSEYPEKVKVVLGIAEE
jgi:peptidyl-prolyl cis-trans isomerase D